MNRLQAVAGVADELEVLSVLEDGAQSLPHDLMVFGNKDGGGHGVFCDRRLRLRARRGAPREREAASGVSLLLLLELLQLSMNLNKQRRRAGTPFVVLALEIGVWLRRQTI